jgi:uncharacterized protein (DUF2062 family)
MPRTFIKKFLPEHRTLLENRWLQPFRAVLHDPALIVPHRRAVARGLAVGLFWAFMPVPLQSFFGAATAIWLRVNVLVAIAACWITNPITAAPIVYVAHAIGAFLLGPAPLPPEAPASVAGDWSLEALAEVWQRLLSLGEAFLLGSLVLAIGAAALGYFALNTFWLWSVRRQFAGRRNAARRLNPPTIRP